MIARLAHTRPVRNAVRFMAAAGIGASAVSCNDTTGPLTPAKPSGVTVVLLSSTSAKVTWIPGADAASVRSYNIFRNAVKVGEVTGPLFIDTGLSELATYRYGVSANGTNGLLSETSDDIPSAVITPPDATPPSVVSTSPTNAATGVDRATKISATFSESLDPTTAIAANFKARSGGADIVGTLAYVSATKTIEFAPSFALPNVAVINVTISGLKDLAGNAMQSPVSFGFTTRDDVPPTVVSTTIPATGDVALSQAISATMSKPVDATSLTSAAVRLVAGTPATSVAGTISYDSPSRTITFTPTAGLAGATDYTFVVGPGIKDLAGNTSTVAFSRAFRTVDLSPPAVTSVTPADQATSVAANAAVNVVFSKDMDASTITTSSFTLRLTSSGAYVGGAVAYDAGTRSASYLPSAALMPGTGYTIAVSNTVRATTGVPLNQSFLSTFTTVPAPDVTPPTVVSVNPAGGASGVGVNTSVTITFSEALNPATITPATVTLTGQGLGAVSGSLIYNAASSVVSFIPASALQSDVGYTATVTTGVTDLAGNGLAANFLSTFQTAVGAPPPDVIPPFVISASPAHGTTGVAVNPTITVSFSEAMNASTVTGSNIFLNGPGGSVVGGTVSYDNSTFSATFTPNAALENEATYTLVATAGLKDVAGNILAAPFTASFTTVVALPPPDATPPTVSSTVPSNGSSNVPVTTAISVTFSEPMTASTINSSTVALFVVGVQINGNVSYDASSRTASFTPAAGLLAEGQVYTLTVTTGVTDASGNALASNFAAVFQTQDLTPPTIASRSPAPGTTGVATNSTIRIGFSEAMNPLTISGSISVSLGGSPVSGSVTYDSNTNVATFTPSSALANYRTYSVQVTTAARDAAGNALASNDSFSFMTVPAPPAFDISGFSRPGDGWWQTTTEGAVNIHFHIIFDQAGSTLSASPSACSSGIQDRCITLARNQAGADAAGPVSPGFAWVLVTSAPGVLSGSQITFTLTNANGRTFTFNGTVTSPYHMTGTISGPTLPAEAIIFDRPAP